MRLAQATALLLLVAALGVGTKFYSGPFASWVVGSAGGVLYEVFWVLLAAHVAAFFGLPLKLRSLVAAVFVATCAIEFAQLWHPPWLEALRASFLGHALLGTTFSWVDFPHYGVGCVIGGALVHVTRRVES